MQNTISTSSSSSSSNPPGAAAAPQDRTPPNQPEAIAIRIFQSTESFSEFKRSPIAEEFIALRLHPEAFGRHLIGDIGRQLLARVVDRQSLCRAAWAFQKLRIGDEEVKASLETKALEILQTPGLPSDGQALILDITAQLGKIGVRNDELLIVLANRVNQLFNPMEPPVDLSYNLKALKSLNSLANGSPLSRQAIVDAISKQLYAINTQIHNQGLQNLEKHQFSLMAKAFGLGEQSPHRVYDLSPNFLEILMRYNADWKWLHPNQMVQALVTISKNRESLESVCKNNYPGATTALIFTLLDSLDKVSFEEIMHLIEELPNLAHFKNDFLIDEYRWVHLLHKSTQRVLQEPSFDNIDQIVTLIKGLGFGMQFHETKIERSPIDYRADIRNNDIAEAMKKNPHTGPIVSKALDVLFRKLVELEGVDHLRTDCLLELMEVIGNSKPEPKLKQDSMDLLGRQLITPQALASLNYDQMDEILSIYPKSNASDATKELVITSLARKIAQEAFPPSRAQYEESLRNHGGPPYSYLEYVNAVLEHFNVKNLFYRFNETIDLVKNQQQVIDAIGTLGGLLTDIEQDPKVFQEVLLPFWLPYHCHPLYFRHLKAEQIVKVMTSLYQMEKMKDLQGAPVLSPNAFRELLQSLALAWADAIEPVNLPHHIVSGILQALGHFNLPQGLRGPTWGGITDERIARCIGRLAEHLDQNGLVDSLTDVELVHAAQGLSLPDVKSDQVKKAMETVLKKLIANYESHRKLENLNDIEIAKALCGLSQNRALFPESGYVINLLAIHLSPDLSALSGELALKTIHVLSNAYPPIPGLASVMCRLVKRWRQSGIVQWEPLTCSYTYETGGSYYTRQCRVVNDEIRSLTQWLAHQEVISQLSLQEAVFFLSSFANSPGFMNPAQPANIMAAKVMEATEEDIGELSPEEAADALRILLESGFSEVNTIHASMRLIPKYQRLSNPLQTIAPKPREAVNLLTAIDKFRGAHELSGTDSERIDCLISTLCQGLQGSDYPGLPLSIDEIATCTQVLRRFNIQSKEVSAAWCSLAGKIIGMVRFGTYGPKSIYSQAGDTAIREQFFLMILQLNELPDTDQILKLRDEFASLLVHAPFENIPGELIKYFGDDEVQCINESYKALSEPTESIKSALQILKPFVEQIHLHKEPYEGDRDSH